MKIEVMIYVYLAICVGMIAFNITSAVLSRVNDKRMVRVSDGFDEIILENLRLLEKTGIVDDKHKHYLVKKLKRIGNFRAFDMALEQEYEKKPELVKQYLQSMGSTFTYLTICYRKRDPVETAYFPYIMKKYEILNGRPFDAMIDMLYSLLSEPSIYCRENALQAIYTIGDADCVIRALKIIDAQNKFYHSKLLTDGLLTFMGNKESLGDALWEFYPEASGDMKITILNYFRFSNVRYCERFYDIMTDEKCDDEIRFSCIRYFGKCYYDKAYPVLLDFARGQNELRWEYSAIASIALGTYPTDETIEVLKVNLHNSNWYIRFNASQALERIGLTYSDLIDIVEGKDRYASEILRYRFDVRDIMEDEKGAAAVCLKY